MERLHGELGQVPESCGQADQQAQIIWVQDGFLPKKLWRCRNYIAYTEPTPPLRKRLGAARPLFPDMFKWKAFHRVSALRLKICQKKRKIGNETNAIFYATSGIAPMCICAVHDSLCRVWRMGWTHLRSICRWWRQRTQPLSDCKRRTALFLDAAKRY